MAIMKLNGSREIKEKEKQEATDDKPSHLLPYMGGGVVELQTL
jgi:hypothetical protein